MRAVLLDAPGPADALRVGQLPEPVADPGRVLVTVAGSSVNPIDAKIRAGAVPTIAPSLPGVLHGDVAGTVLALGEGVSGIAVGEAVYGCAGGVLGSDGALAECMRCDPALLAPAPRSLPLAEAAALPLVGITAWEMLDRLGEIAGQEVLIHAGSGGVGHLLVQLAKVRGAVVHATVSNGSKAELVRDLGADAVLVCRPGQDAVLAERSGRYAAVCDTLGEAALGSAFASVAGGGRVVTCVARSRQDLSQLHGKAASLHCVFMLRPLLHGAGRAAHGRILRDLAELVDAGRVRPLIDPRRFTIDQAAAAHALLESGRHLGKILLAGWGS